MIRSTFLSRGQAALRWLGRRIAGAPVSHTPWAVLRIGLAVLLLTQALALAPYLDDLFGPRALVPEQVTARVVPACAPRLAWVAAGLAPLGVGPAVAVRLVLAVHVLAALAMLVGWRTRTAVTVAWLTELLFKSSGHLTMYGGPEVINVALFFCLFVPAGAALSLDALRRRGAAPARGHNRLALRCPQLYLAYIYFTAGLAKASGSSWWNGEAIWRALTRADMGTFDFGWLAWVPWLPVVLGCGTIVLEMGYPAAVCLPQLRRWWVVLTILLHVGIAVALGLWLFAAIMILLNVCTWLVPADGVRRAAPATRSPARISRTARPAEEVLA
jgi:hypothetical protein